MPRKACVTELFVNLLIDESLTYALIFHGFKAAKLSAYLIALYVSVQISPNPQLSHTSIHPTTFDMNYSGLGVLENLPPEVRAMIFEFAVTWSSDDTYGNSISEIEDKRRNLIKPGLQDNASSQLYRELQAAWSRVSVIRVAARHIQDLEQYLRREDDLAHCSRNIGAVHMAHPHFSDTDCSNCFKALRQCHKNLGIPAKGLCVVVAYRDVRYRDPFGCGILFDEPSWLDIRRRVPKNAHGAPLSIEIIMGDRAGSVENLDRACATTEDLLRQSLTKALSSCEVRYPKRTPIRIRGEEQRMAHLRSIINDGINKVENVSAYLRKRQLPLIAEAMNFWSEDDSKVEAD